MDLLKKCCQDLVFFIDIWLNFSLNVEFGFLTGIVSVAPFDTE